MIDLTDDDVARFQELHRRETGRALTEDQARDQALNLIRLVEFLLRIESKSSR